MNLYRRASFHQLPDTEAGCRMPSGNSILLADRARRADAERGSKMLLEGLRRYFERGGRA